MLEKCLNSLAAADINTAAEVVVGLNGGADNADVARISERWPWARFILLPGYARGKARNHLVPMTKGDLLFFLDDDASVRPDFLRRLTAAAARNPHAVVLGGPNLGPSSAPAFERAVDFLLRSFLGAGPMRKRYVNSGTEKPSPSWSFMLSGLAIRRSVFDELGITFPTDCVSAEENLFTHRIEQAAGPGVFCPDLWVTHHRRPTLSSFLSQVYVNGKGRAQITRADPSSLQIAVFAPTALALWALFSGIMPTPWNWAPGAAYAAAITLETLRLAVSENEPGAAVRLPVLFPLAHCAYAFGFWNGMLRRR